MIKVTALISLYNSLEYVEQCLQDLVQQSLFKKGELELLVIDSNSPQDERAVVERFQARYDNIRYVRTAERETLYQAWNTGLAHARGKYITNANSDDRHHCENLEILAKVLDNRHDIDLAYADVFESTISNQTFADNPGTSRYVYPDFFAPLSLLFYQFGCQPLWRREVHDKIGLFDSVLRAAGDWEFCIRFSMAGLRAIRVPNVLGSFLHRPTSISTQDSVSTDEQRVLRERYLNPGNILALYEKEGWGIQSSEEKAQIFSHFASLASNLKLPWQPGEICRDVMAAVLACVSAYEVDERKAQTAWNLGVALQRASKLDAAVRYLVQGALSGRIESSRALDLYMRGESVDLPFVEL